jgi:hypothetical protein
MSLTCGDETSMDAGERRKTMVSALETAVSWRVDQTVIGGESWSFIDTLS